ncbi:hypothetical protein V493_00702 [Pseudogymnoascus sp. VKM F-4281 (FW-2241)]|nr:hypothetical protein V493_00702 [Pseudogymnoascus sp. VKM F-4281 (FW-2241)]
MMKPTIALGVFAALLSPALSATIRINALGDSITGSPGCWRAILYQKLQAEGLTGGLDFVGTLSGQGCGIPYDGENDGHGGFLATGIANNNQLPGWLSVSKPDIVMLQLGTNDVWSNISPSTILTAFSKLVDQMRVSKSNMHIVVAQITPMNPSSCPDCAQRVVAFNAAIPAWAASKSTSQSPITVADIFTGFNTGSDTGDGVHPNNSGNQKIADSWFGPLKAAIAAAGGAGPGPTTPPVTTAPPTTSTKTTPPPASTTTPPATGTVPLYGQCGGMSWTGGTACAIGTCKFSNPWYSQCLN